MTDKISFHSFYTDSSECDRKSEDYDEYKKHDLLLELIETLVPDSVSVESYCETPSGRRYLPSSKQLQYQTKVLCNGYTCTFDDGYLVRIDTEKECTIDFDNFLCSEKVEISKHNSEPFHLINHENVKLILYCWNWPKPEESSFLTCIEFEEIKTYAIDVVNKLTSRSIRSGCYKICNSDLVERYLDHVPDEDFDTKFREDFDYSKVHSVIFDSEDQLYSLYRYTNVKEMTINISHQRIKKFEFPKLDVLSYDNHDYNFEYNSISLTELPEANHYTITVLDPITLIIDRPIKSLKIVRPDFDEMTTEEILQLVEKIQFDYFPTDKIEVDYSVFTFKDRMKMPKSARDLRSE